MECMEWPGWSKLPCAVWSMVTSIPVYQRYWLLSVCWGRQQFAKRILRGSLPGGMQGTEDTGSQGHQKHRTQNNHLELLLSVSALAGFTLSGLAGFTLSRALGHKGCFVAYSPKHLTWWPVCGTSYHGHFGNASAEHLQQAPAARELSLLGQCTAEPACLASPPTLHAWDCAVRVPTRTHIPSPLSPPPLQSKCIHESLEEVHLMTSQL